MSLLNSKRREEVETTIRSCLVASPGDVTVQQLNKDYYEFEGEHIPFREFSCQSLIDFLKQLRNVLWLENRGGLLYVHGIDSEKSRHVSTLVEGQRPSKNRFSHRRAQRPSYGFAGGRPQRQLRALSHEVVICGNNLYPAKRTGATSQRPSATTYIPPPRLRASSQSSSNDSYSRPNPPAEVMTETAPSAQMLIRFTGEDDDADDADDIPPKYPSPTSEPPRRNGYRDQETSRQNCESHNSYKETKQDYYGKQDPYRVQDSYRDQNSHRSQDSYREEGSHGKQDSYRETSNYARDSRNMGNSLRDKYDDTNHSQDKNHYEESRRLAEAVYNREDCGEDNDIVNDDNILDQDYIEDRSALINQRIRARLANLIQNHPDGIWCADLPQKYLEEFRIPLNYLELGFNSVCEFASQLPSIFHCVRPTNAGDYKVFNAKLPVPNLRNEEPQTRETLASKYSLYDDGEDDPEVFPGRLDPSTTKKLYPEGVMELKETVGHISVTVLGKEHDFEEVEVSEVFTPSFFWIQLRRKLPKFRKLMYELEAYYENNKSKYQIPLIMLEKGLNVACVYAQKWHRGLIKTVLPDGRSTVHFYDYGTVKSYLPDELYFLHRRFSYLPAQAIPCGLFNVRPYETDKWSKTITWEFVKRTSVPLIATIGARNEEENSLLVSLTDTRGDEDFHINDWMYLKKYAQQGRMKIDLQNLCEYEEAKLPKWDQVVAEEEKRKARKHRHRRDEERTVNEIDEFKDQKDKESIDIFSPSNLKTPQRPPPGFSALNAIVEEPPHQPFNNSKEFIAPDVPKNPTIPETYTPDLSFMNGNCSPNLYLNMAMNAPNILGKNGLNPSVDATKIQVGIFNILLQMNNLAMMIGQQTVTNPAAALLMQGQMNILMKQFQEMQFSNTQYANPILQSPNFLGSSPQKTTSPSNFIKLTPTPSESAELMANLSSSRTSLSSSGQSFESAKSRVATPADPPNNYQSINPSASKEKVDENRNFWEPKKPDDDSPLNFSLNMDDFFKGVPKLSDKAKTFKNTNPFKTSLSETKPDRASLKSFYEDPPPVPSRDPNLIKKPKIEYFKTSNTSNKTSSEPFVFRGSEKEESSSADLRRTTHNFDPVVCPTTAKENQGPRVVYEAGPVMYKNNVSETKTSNNYSYDSSRWKPIPPADEPSWSRETVQINVNSFNITKPKSPAERLKEKKLKGSLDLIAEQYTLLNAPESPRSTITLTDFNTQNWVNAHILSPGKLQNNERPYDEVSNCSDEDDVPTPVQRPPAEILVSVTDTSPNPKAEIFATVTEGRRLIENKPESITERVLQTPFANGTTIDETPFENGPTIDEIPFENGPTIDETEYSSKNTASSGRKSTNPFVEDYDLKNSSEESERVLNGVTHDLGVFTLADKIEEPRIETREVSQHADDSSVCFVYQLSSKNMSIIVINMNDEGWLCTDEFVTAFTTLQGGGSVLLSVLDMLSLKVPFQAVDRSTHPLLLSELDYTSLPVQRDSQNRICRPVHLTPLKATLRILTKMKIIKREEMNAAIANKQYENGSILSDMMHLISSYGIFMRTRCKN
ncbi:uncharacterized protein LOC117179433 isoform X3 [Belonocnema kinseyi]|uniref:uncharacterized protein LOC117179433 isoform X3 n=1 Tax=Belonocnema kinseyi TaxID=2817044 RepID=UPI00143D3987|nr:uncharacterized protein LOC117179433 isoform X3 [Belonocnema kinseyi]